MAVGVTAVLVITGVCSGEADRLLRAGAAAAVVGAGWFLVVFAVPSAIGLGDVRLFTVTAGLLGWAGWSAVLTGQLVAFLFAGVTALAIAVARPRLRGRLMPVPMGPAILAAAFLTCWLPLT
jgi:leader peptidase (prepilin peptidase)/N-methyltransferase